MTRSTTSLLRNAHIQTRTQARIHIQTQVKIHKTQDIHKSKVRIGVPPWHGQQQYSKSNIAAGLVKPVCGRPTSHLSSINSHDTE